MVSSSVLQSVSGKNPQGGLRTVCEVKGKKRFVDGDEDLKVENTSTGV